jgi:hypothetical protein
MKKVYHKRKTILEYCAVKEGIRGKKLGLRKESHTMSPRGDKFVQ